MGPALNEGAIDKAIANEGTIGSAGALLIVSHGGAESSIVRPKTLIEDSNATCIEFSSITKSWFGMLRSRCGMCMCNWSSH